MIAFILSPLGRALGIVALVAAILGGVYFKGRHDASKACADRQLRAEIAILQEDAKQQALALSDARMRAARLTKTNDSITLKVRQYETRLKENGACKLTASDVRFLRGLLGKTR